MALDNFRTQKIIWDRANKKVFEKIEANSGDTNGRKLVVQIINQETTEVLSGTTLSLGWKSRNGAKGLDAFDVVDASKGIFEIYYTTEMLSNIGDIEASLILINPTSRIESSTFTISVRPSTVDDESVESENSFTALTEALVKVNDFDAQLAQTIEGVSEKTANVLSFGATGIGAKDETDFIRQAVSKAASYYVESNVVGGTNSYTGNGKLKIPAGIYGISSKITIPYGVDLDLTGAIFQAIPADKTIDCFDMTANGFRNDIIGGTFVGFKTAFTISTKNRNTSRVLFDGFTAHNCKLGIDTVSFETFRSTNLTIKNFQSIQTDQFLRAFSDMVHLTDGWLDHTGYDGAVIHNSGYMKIDNVIGVPHLTKTGARPRWIDNHNVSTIQPGERGLMIEHCRFGGEAGSCPIVFNYAIADMNLVDGYCASIISIDNTTIFSSSASYGDNAAIVLFALPNRISITNSSGISNLPKGLITCDPSFDSTIIPTSRLISIQIDSSSKGATTFPLVHSDLARFLMTDDTPYNAFRQSFKDGNFYKKYPVQSSDNALAKSTFKLQTQTNMTSGAEQRNAGISFLVNISSSYSGTFTSKSNSLYLVSVTTGIDVTPKKKLNFSLLAEHGGGNVFSQLSKIQSIHWGSDYTGSATTDISSTEENVTISFLGGSNSSMTILPLYGIDNYS